MTLASTAIAPIPTLETKRLILRAFRAEDFPAFAALSADPELMRFVGGVMSPREAWRRMSAYAGLWLLRGYGVFALEDKGTGQFAGYSGIYDPEDWPEREINWGLARAFLGCGLATEAAERVRRYAYEILKFETITSCIVLDNEPSIRVAKRLGATLDRTVDDYGRRRGVFRHPSPDNAS